MDAYPVPHVRGDRLAIRTVTNGRIRWAAPAISVMDTTDRIAYFRRGPMRVMVTRGAAMGATTSRRERELMLRKELLDGTWDLVEKQPVGGPGGSLVIADVDDWFSVKLSPDDEGQFVPNYVNIERPHRRTKIGFDADDLCLDILVHADGSWSIKDAEDFDERCALGIYPPAEREAVFRARDQAIARIESRTGAFDCSWQTWRPEESWTSFTLPSDWASV